MSGNGLGAAPADAGSLPTGTAREVFAHVSPVDFGEELGIL
jgi:hypothetical protein